MTWIILLFVLFVALYYFVSVCEKTIDGMDDDQVEHVNEHYLKSKY